MAITTGKVRASYVHVFQPRTPDNGGEPKYSVTLLIPKSDAATLNCIYAEIERAKQDGAQKAFGGNIPPQCRTPIYDGDGYRQSGEAFGEECRGCMVITASAKQQPVVVGLDMQNIINPAELYSGCYIRANINFFAYNSNGNKGIGCGLNAVQKIEDGEPLTMRVSAQEAFGGANTYSGGTPVYPGGQPGYSYPGASGGYPPSGQQAPYAAPAVQPQAAYAEPSVPQQVPYQQAPYAAPPVQPQAAYAAPPVPQQAPYQQMPGQPSQQGYPGGAVDPITGRPVTAGGVMGI